MPHSASSLPPFYRHSRLTIVRRGCWMCRIAGIHGEAMYAAPDCAARAAIQAANCQCRGSRDPPLAFSWGSKGDILSRERISPFPRAAPKALLFPGDLFNRFGKTLPTSLCCHLRETHQAPHPSRCGQSRCKCPHARRPRRSGHFLRCGWARRRRLHPVLWRFSARRSRHRVEYVRYHFMQEQLP